MPVSVQPTFNCLAVRHAAEMGPRREPRLRAMVRRLRRRRWSPTWSPRRPARPQAVILGDRSRAALDRLALVAGIGTAAIVLGFLATRA